MTIPSHEPTAVTLLTQYDTCILFKLAIRAQDLSNHLLPHFPHSLTSAYY